MASRMDRYNEKTTSKSRSEMNQDLYKTIYDMGEYSNIEGIATLDKTNEIDIRKIKELLQNREDYQKQKKYQNLIKQEEMPTITPLEPETPEKNYDIRDVLTKAKSERIDTDESYYNFKKQNYHILEEIDARKKDNDDQEKADIKDLINTITNTSLINKLDDEALSLDMLEDLKSTGDTVVEEPATVTKILDETIPKAKDDEDTTTNLDKSFFTSSLNFTNSDFEELKEMTDTIKKNSLWLKVFVLLIGICVMTFLVYLVFRYLS